MISPSLGIFMVMTIVFNLLAISHLFALPIAVGQVKNQVKTSFALCTIICFVCAVVTLILAVVQRCMVG